MHQTRLDTRGSGVICRHLALVEQLSEQKCQVSSAERFKQEFPETRLRVIADSDHFLPLEKGEEVSHILVEFFG
jgi:pimeloyl-ACP methyl ester carboxylesterase